MGCNNIHVFLLFFGGPDATHRLVLEFVVQVCPNPRMMLGVKIIRLFLCMSTPCSEEKNMEEIHASTIGFVCQFFPFIFGFSSFP